MIGDQEAGCEIVMLDSFDEEAEEWTVVRGVWDTVPVAWAEGTLIWAFSFGPSRSDPSERVSGETRIYRLLPKTSFNRLPYEEASDIEVTFTERPFAPFRPANCQLDGTGFVGVDYSIEVTTDPLPATIAATWSNRNRQTEDSLIPAWDDMGVAAEVGQTTVLRIYNIDGEFSHEITGLTGESYDIPIAAFDPINRGTVQFVSERDGIRSLWGVHIPFDIRRTGYGLKYGLNYGI
ncbi:putative tail protein [Synechococcus virus S-ESS1]|uniref:Putative tail protein n=1 Tax=Synechococcus virus S-ESS1 TaxID=1964565 RepID=A0A1V0DX58_9CAUD|nr:tail protein [Synechococcus virus S-ESS1]ARB05721.1 putative tail protein [Synechococcus virus S-ESS1]